jgi:hypothetical protein
MIIPDEKQYKLAAMAPFLTSPIWVRKRMGAWNGFCELGGPKQRTPFLVLTLYYQSS